MKLIDYIVFFLLFLVAMSLASFAPSNYKLEGKATKHLSRYYQGDVMIVENTIEGIDGTMYDILGTSDRLFIGYARSKFETFDYMVLFDSGYTIKLVRVLVYRENYGGEVGSKRWLSKWIGVNKPKPFVDAISGATISVNSLKWSINSLLSRVRGGGGAVSPHRKK